MFLIDLAYYIAISYTITYKLRGYPVDGGCTQKAGDTFAHEDFLKLWQIYNDEIVVTFRICVRLYLDTRSNIKRWTVVYIF